MIALAYLPGDISETLLQGYLKANVAHKIVATILPLVYACIMTTELHYEWCEK